MYRWILLFLMIPTLVFGQFRADSPGTMDSIGVDTNGDGTIDNYIYPAVIREGTNITLTVSGDTLLIAGAAGAGTQDSIGIDTDGNGTVDGYIMPAFLKGDSTNALVFTLAGDTLTITAGVMDSAHIGAGVIYNPHIANSTITPFKLNDVNTQTDLMLLGQDTATTNFRWYFIDELLGLEPYAMNGYVLHINTTADPDSLYWGLAGSGTGWNWADSSSYGADSVLWAHKAVDDSLGARIHATYARNNGDTVTGTYNFTQGDLENIDSIAANIINAPDTFIMDGEVITHMTGTGIGVVGGQLAATLGTDISSSEIVNGTIDSIDIAAKAIRTYHLQDSSVTTTQILNQTITKSDQDTTASNFIFDNAYEGTSAVADSQYSTHNFVRLEIEDSLDEYSPTSELYGIKASPAVADNYVLKIDTDTNPDSFYWAEDNNSGAGLDSAEIMTVVRDSLGGTSTRTDNYVLKIDVTPNPDTFYWAADATGGAGNPLKSDSAGTITALDSLILQAGNDIILKPNVQAGFDTLTIKLDTTGFIPLADFADSVMDVIRDSTAVPDSADIKAWNFVNDSTGIAGFGYVAGAHTDSADVKGWNFINDSTGIAAKGFVAGAHTDSADVEGWNFVNDSVEVAGLGFSGGPHTDSTKVESWNFVNDSVEVAALGFAGGPHTVLNDTLLGTGEAAAIYAPIANPSFTGTLTADSGQFDGNVDIDSMDVNGAADFTGTTTVGTVAGAIDAGGATSLEIPNAANPTTDAEGEIAWDSNDDALEVYSGDESESALIPMYKYLNVSLVVPDSMQTYTPDLKIFHVNGLIFPFGIEIDSVEIQLDADAAYSMVIEEWSGADPPVYQNAVSTVTTGAADTYAGEVPDTDGNLDAGDWIVLDIPTTDVPFVNVGIYYHVTQGN